MISHTLNIIQYITLVALSIGTGYVLNDIVKAIKKGDFFDWEQKKRAYAARDWISSRIKYLEKSTNKH